MKKTSTSVVINSIKVDWNLFLVSYEGFEHPAKYDILDNRVSTIVDTMLWANYFPGQIKKILEENWLIKKRVSAQEFLDNILEGL